MFFFLLVCYYFICYCYVIYCFICFVFSLTLIRTRESFRLQVSHHCCIECRLAFKGRSLHEDRQVVAAPFKKLSNPVGVACTQRHSAHIPTVTPTRVA